MLAAIALLARGGPAGTVFVPVWAAYPAVGFGDRTALSTLRSDAADRLVTGGRRCDAGKVAGAGSDGQGELPGLRHLRCRMKPRQRIACGHPAVPVITS
jgi:hypothetical protein